MAKSKSKLQLFEPFIGRWKAKTDSPMGLVICTRTFNQILDKKYVQLTAKWELPDRKYDELAVYGINEEGSISFWSFTSDGKRSEGKLADVSDVDKNALGFEAQMPAGLARMAYWFDADNNLHWVVESKNKRGWKRFVEHIYLREDS